jgi:hypothetical protein
MKDLITYVPSLSAMVAEAVAIQDDEESTLARYFTVDDEGGVSFNVSKVPVVRTLSNQSLCLVRGISRTVIESSTTIQVIGEVVGGEYIFDEGGQTIYEGIHDVNPRMIDDGEGGQYLYTPHYNMGGFC